MINKQDLRIGNLVKIDEEIYSIYQLLGGGIDVNWVHSANELAHTRIGYDYISPIPLTEVWLLKLGFQSRHWLDNSWRIKMPLGMVMILDNFCVSICEDSGESIMLPNKYHYVHQIQNVFYTLTNQELTVQI